MLLLNSTREPTGICIQTCFSVSLVAIEVLQALVSEVKGLNVFPTKHFAQVENGEMFSCIKKGIVSWQIFSTE